jgi:hypothetical protein
MLQMEISQESIATNSTVVKLNLVDDAAFERKREIRKWLMVGDIHLTQILRLPQAKST